MRRAFIVAAAALTLAGCGSLPSMDFMKSTPPQMTLQLESVPPGAEAKTSLGPTCRTPCAVSVPATPSFTVTYTLDRYQPQTVPVQLVEPQFNQQDAGSDSVTIPEARFEPSPVYVELQPAAPPARKKGPSKAAPKRAPAPAAAAAPAAAIRAGPCGPTKPGPVALPTPGPIRLPAARALEPLIWTRFLYANRYPPPDQVRWHASLENAMLRRRPRVHKLAVWQHGSPSLRPSPPNRTPVLNKIVVPPTGLTARPAPMRDTFGRDISYLRVSVTDRCDFRCLYCMSEDMTFLPKKDVLTLEELDRLCGAFIAKGVRKLRLTGGEPLVRRNVMQLIRSLSRHLQTGALDELTLTTNGSQLARFADELYATGIRRINVSLDTRDAKLFRDITRWGDLDKVMDGIDAARRAGLAVKINTVALKGVNEDEIPDLVRWAHSLGMELTLIEVMPLGDVGRPHRSIRPAVACPHPSRDAVHDERSPRLHRRTGALCACRRDRRPSRIHYADDAQFLRELQPRAHHLHRHAAHLPGSGRRHRPARAAARIGRQRPAQRRDRRRHRPEAEGA